MRHIADFIEQLERGKDPFKIWVYASKGQYSQFGNQGKQLRTPQLYKALDQHLQVVIETNQDAFLLLPEVHAVVPVAFQEGQVHTLTQPNAA
ncbi:hypothetical protein [Photobacterium atrarenae]|uniref:Uncharacterized protein n=1 Tax=Photobacterium atrarenae TaxID=865757 RepID=A0ABY5GK79_9GAMM|nr:hypothetical protein [Photobacterium atrarenae]UTV29738.1 hypothetical protein NNL38_22270 [Photobacterium atrarenae]